ncbi:unnamed protein product, partial [Sphacelaria rigidula]
GWRSRGAAGRRPVCREAVRQLHVSERLHRTSETIARKQEATRQRRRDLMQARLVVASTGRLNLCPKTRAFTDNSPKYKYGGRSGRGGHGSKEQQSYLDAGDRMYSEWEASRRKEERRRELVAEGAKKRNGEAWCCPKCGVENRAQDDTCQTITGIAVPAQELRPDTWYLETPEKLGKTAAAVTAGTATGKQDDRNRRNDGGGVSSDGLRRCGRARPPLFKPTSLAKPGNSSATRPTGEVSLTR